MLAFVKWLAMKPLDEDLQNARRHLGRALVARNSDGDVLTPINHFKDSIWRCSNKASQGSDSALAHDLASVFSSLSREADEAVSEPDPSLQRYMLASLLRRMEAEDNPGYADGSHLRHHRVFGPMVKQD